MSTNSNSLQNAFRTVSDFRQPQGRRYNLQAILTLSCLAMMHGAQNERAIAEWSGNDGRRWLSMLGIRRRKGPSAATFQRILKGVDRSQLEHAMRDWSSQAMGGSEFDSALQADQKDSFHTIGSWLEKIMNTFPAGSMANESQMREALIEELAIKGHLETMEPSMAESDHHQHISDAGLKIWGVDLNSHSDSAYRNI